MKSSFSYFFLIIAVSLMASCDSTTNISRDIQINGGGINIFCHLNKSTIKHMSVKEKSLFKLGEDELSYVRGEIKLKNTTKNDITYDLNDYYLSVGDALSSNIYIDSVASQLIVKKALKPGQMAKESVYWVFNGRLKAEDAAKIRLIKKEKAQRQ